ncbi:MAG: HAMP domain-containing protein [Sedimenticola thiotaurini]|uniref:histidine kinase n=1 Tax=Sedimenticola thiotaurini TaxID=1543721 RepID=A0A558D178_9GAMM|nr:MAG: HAMP domain-containing protein [Sedimenticola thiotaurini]
MKLFKMLKTQIAAALVLIMLLFGSIFTLSMVALNEQQSYNTLLNITTRLQQSAQNLVTLGLNYSMNVPQDSSSYERDVKLYYRAILSQVEMIDDITHSFMTEQFSPTLTNSGAAYHPHLTPEAQRAVFAVEEIWKSFKEGVIEALGNDNNMPRLDKASEYIARYHSPLAASIDILLSKIQQQTEQQLNQVYQLHLALLFAAVIITFGVFGWFYLAVLKPLRYAVDGFQKVAQGDFGYQVPVASENELAMMTHSFNTLSMRLHAIFKLIDKIQQGSDLYETLGFVADEFSALLPLDWVGALFVSYDNSTIVLEGSYRSGKAEVAPHRSYPLKNTLLLKALESGEPLHIPNMPDTGSENADFQFLNHLISGGLKDAIFMPISELSPIPGVLAFATCNENAYTPKHLELLSNIAGLITHSFGKTVRLAEHSRLAAIGSFASSIAHEIRSPLSTITMALDYFQSAELPGAASKRADLAHREADRMARLLEEILLYAKPLQLQLKPVDLKQLLRQLFETHQEIPKKKQQQFEWVIADAELITQGDPDRLIQVFLNLAQNACEAAPPESTIRWSLHKEPLMGSIKIALNNMGEPIPEDHLEKLIEPFFTTKTNGTGLGLSIVKRIIDAHGGDMKIASNLQQGTTITLLLPQA